MLSYMSKLIIIKLYEFIRYCSIDTGKVNTMSMYWFLMHIFLLMVDTYLKANVVIFIKHKCIIILKGIF